jgi:hypothetical protein
MKESDIQRQIVQWAKSNPHLVPCLFRVNSGTFQSFTGYIVAGAPKGTPDLIGYLPDGRMLAVEVKGPKGVRSVEQVEWSKKAKSHGCKVLCVQSLQAFVKALLDVE